MRRGFGHVYRKRYRDKDGQLRERRGWYLRYTDPRTGRRVDAHGGTTKKDAERKLGDLERILWEERHLGRSRPLEISLQDFLPELLASLRATLAENSYTISKAHLEEIAAHLGDLPMSRVTRADAQAWIAKVRREPRGRWPESSPRTLAPLSLLRMVGNARRAWNLAIEMRYATQNPWSRPRLPRVHSKPVPYISADQLLSLYSRVKDLHPAVKPVVVLLGETGLRRSECFALEWRDIAPDRATLTVRRSKSGRPRTVPLTPRAQAALAELEAARTGKSPQDRIVVLKRDLVYRTVRRASRALGLGDSGGVGLHILRHAFASGLADAGVPLKDAAHLLGHTNLQVTQRYYAHLAPYSGKTAIDLLARARGQV